MSYKERSKFNAIVRRKFRNALRREAKQFVFNNIELLTLDCPAFGYQWRTSGSWGWCISIWRYYTGENANEQAEKYRQERIENSEVPCFNTMELDDIVPADKHASLLPGGGMVIWKRPKISKAATPLLHGIKCLETGKIYETPGKAAKDVGLKSKTSILNALADPTKTAAKLHWSRV